VKQINQWEGKGSTSWGQARTLQDDQTIKREQSRAEQSRAEQSRAELPHMHREMIKFNTTAWLRAMVKRLRR
jgi:hypothetical protein